MNAERQTMLYFVGMTGRPTTKEPSKVGARLAELRRQAGLSQVELAKSLGMPQRTLSYYEREAADMPTALLSEVARVLGVEVTDILQPEKAEGKRGPKSKIERQIDAVRQLPRGEQDFISKLLDNVLQHAAVAR